MAAQQSAAMTDQVILALIPAVVTVLLALIALGDRLSTSRKALNPRG